MELDVGLEFHSDCGGRDHVQLYSGGCPSWTWLGFGLEGDGTESSKLILEKIRA